MTTPVKPNTWSAHGLRRLATSFVGQEHVGILGGLLLRLARFLQGDPGQYLNVVSVAGAQTALPDYVPALSVTFVVIGGPIIFRTDAGALLAADAQIPAGSIVTLTGQATIKGFRFASIGGATVALVGEYYD